MQEIEWTPLKNNQNTVPKPIFFSPPLFVPTTTSMAYMKTRENWLMDIAQSWLLLGATEK